MVRKQLSNGFTGFFGKMGEICVKYPWPFMIFGILLAVALSIGMIQTFEEDDLFYPVQIPDSRTDKEREEYEDTYGGITRLQQVVLSHKDDVFTVEAFDAYLSIVDEISTGPQVPTALNITFLGETYYWRDFCERPPVPAIFGIGSQVWEDLNNTLLALGATPLPPNFGITVFPCVRPQVLDCFQEGMYDLPPEMQRIEFIQQAFGWPNSLAGLRFGQYLRKPSYRDPSIDIETVVAEGFQRNAEDLPSNCTDWSGLPLEPQSIMHRSLSRDETTGEYDLSEVRSLRTVYRNFDPDAPLYQQFTAGFGWDSEDREKAVFKMEKKFISYLKDFWNGKRGTGFHGDEPFGDYDVDLFAWRSKDDVWTDIGEASSGLVLAGYLIMVAYVILVVGIRWSRRCGTSILVHSRTLLCLMGVGVVALAAVASFGFMAYVGVPTTVWATQVVPFVALGLGIDDMFVILENFRQSAVGQPVSQRMRQCLALAGPSVTLTSLANFSVFMISSAWSMRSIQWFAYQMATNVFLNWLLLLTVFVPMVGFDAQRIRAGRWDWLICAKTPPEDAADDNEHFDKTSRSGGYIYGATFRPIIYRWWACLLVVLGFAVILAVGIYGITEVTVNTAPSDLTLEGSYQEDFMFLLEDRFATADPVVVTREIDYPARQEELDELGTDISSSPHLSAVTNFARLYWYNRFRGFVAVAFPSAIDSNGYIIEAQFYPLFKAWITTAGVGSQLDLLCGHGAIEGRETDCAAPDTVIVQAKGLLLCVDLFDVDDNLEAVEDLRKRADRSIPGEAYTHGFIYLWYDSHADLEDDTLRACGTALATVSMIVFFFQLSPVMALIVACFLAMIMTEVTGYMALFGLNLSTWAYTNVVIAISYGVEFTVHLSRAFLVADGSRRNRVITAVREMGGPMVNGLMSSFLATVPMAFADVALIRDYYFGMFAVMLIISFINGFILLPIVLAFVGPAPLPVDNLDADDLLPDDDRFTKEENEENDVHPFCL